MLLAATEPSTAHSRLQHAFRADGRRDKAPSRWRVSWNPWKLRVDWVSRGTLWGKASKRAHPVALYPICISASALTSPSMPFHMSKMSAADHLSRILGDVLRIPPAQWTEYRSRGSHVVVPGSARLPPHVFFDFSSPRSFLLDFYTVRLAITKLARQRNYHCLISVFVSRQAVQYPGYPCHLRCWTPQNQTPI